MRGKPLLLETFTLLLIATSTFYPIFADDSLPNLIDSIEPSVLKVTTDAGRLGSGFVIKDGLVVTNRHVMEDATAATVHFKDGRTFDVEGIVFDGKSLDLCILRCLGLSGDNSKSLPIAERTVRQGERVLTFGMPQDLEFSVSEGIVSAHRIVNGQALIQTTAPISAGNSGGPLIAVLDSKLVGINTFTRTDGQNLNFAISATELSHALGKLASKPAPLNLTKDNPNAAPNAPSPKEIFAKLKVFWKKQTQAAQLTIQKEISSLKAQLGKSKSEGRLSALRVQLAHLQFNHAVAGKIPISLAPNLHLKQVENLTLGSYGFIQEHVEVHQPYTPHSSLITPHDSMLFYKLEDLNDIELKGGTIIESQGLPPMYISGTHRYESLIGLREVYTVKPIPEFDKFFRDFITDQENALTEDKKARDAEIKAAKTRTWKSGKHEAAAEFISVKSSAATGVQLVSLRRADGVEINIPIDQLSSDDQRWISDYGRSLKIPASPIPVNHHEIQRTITVKAKPDLFQINSSRRRQRGGGP